MASSAAAGVSISSSARTAPRRWPCRSRSCRSPSGSTFVSSSVAYSLDRLACRVGGRVVSSSWSAASLTSANASGRSCASRSDAPRNITIARSTNTRGGWCMFVARRREQRRHAAQLRGRPAASARPPATTPSSSGCGRRRRSPTRRSSDCASTSAPCRDRAASRRRRPAGSGGRPARRREPRGVERVEPAPRRAEPLDFGGDRRGREVLELAVVACGCRCRRQSTDGVARTDRGSRRRAARRATAPAPCRATRSPPEPALRTARACDASHLPPLGIRAPIPERRQAEPDDHRADQRCGRLLDRGVDHKGAEPEDEHRRHHRVTPDPGTARSTPGAIRRRRKMATPPSTPKATDANVTHV